MNDNRRTIPVGPQVLGRVLNANGETIDGQNPLNDVLRMPIDTLALAKESEGHYAPDQMLETGIKVIDLLAPIPRGGIIGMLSAPGLGKLVVIEEIVHSMLTHHNGSIVCIGMGESTYQASALWDIIRDVEAENKSVFLFEQMLNSQNIRQQLLRAGRTIGAHLANQGHEVLLLIGENVIAQDNEALLQSMKHEVTSKALTTFWLEPPVASLHPNQSRLLNGLDAQIVFSRELSSQSVWPAIDRLLSTSRLFDGEAVLGSEHMQVARQVQQLVRRYTGLPDVAAISNFSPEDQQALRRAERLQFFLTQPFCIAEPYTDIPGEYVKLTETIQGCKALLEGHYDEVPARAFYFVGSLDQALAKGNTTM